MTSAHQAPTSSTTTNNNNNNINSSNTTSTDDQALFSFDTFGFSDSLKFVFNAQDHDGFHGSQYDLESTETQSVFSHGVISDPGFGDRFLSNTDATSESYVEKRDDEQERRYQTTPQEELLLPLPHDYALFPGTDAELDSTRQLDGQYLSPVDYSLLSENFHHGRQDVRRSIVVVGDQPADPASNRARYPQSLHINAPDFDAALPNTSLNNSFSQGDFTAVSSAYGDQTGVDILRGTLARGEGGYPNTEFNFLIGDPFQVNVPAGTVFSDIAGSALSAVASHDHDRPQHDQRRRGLDTISEAPRSTPKRLRPRARSAVEPHSSFARQIVSDVLALPSKSLKKKSKTHAERPRKHECTFPECDMTFVNPKDLRKHYISKHTSEKPFKCTRENCPQRSLQAGFGRKDWLLRHLRGVHGCTSGEAINEAKIYDEFHFTMPPNSTTTSDIQHREET